MIQSQSSGRLEGIERDKPYTNDTRGNNRVLLKRQQSDVLFGSTSNSLLLPYSVVGPESNWNQAV